MVSVSLHAGLFVTVSEKLSLRKSFARAELQQEEKGEWELEGGEAVVLGNRTHGLGLSPRFGLSRKIWLKDCNDNRDTFCHKISEQDFCLSET